MAFVKLLLFLVIIKLGIFAENYKENSNNNFDGKQKLLSIKKRAANSKNQQNVYQKVIIKGRKPAKSESPDPAPEPPPIASEPPVSTAEQTVAVPESPPGANAAGPNPVGPNPGGPNTAGQPQQYGPENQASSSSGSSGYPPAAQSNQGPAYSATNQGPAYASSNQGPAYAASGYPQAPGTNPGTPVATNTGRR